MRHCETPNVAVIQHGVQKTGILIKHNEMTIEVTNALREREHGNGNKIIFAGTGTRERERKFYSTGMGTGNGNNKSCSRRTLLTT